MSKTIATVTDDCLGCRDGEVKVSTFKPGDEVTGELADALISMKKAKPKSAGKAPAPENKAALTAPETK